MFSHSQKFCSPFPSSNNYKLKKFKVSFLVVEKKEKERDWSKSSMCFVVGSWDQVCIIKFMQCAEVDAFQMRSKFVFDLCWVTPLWHTPWKTLTPLISNDISFVTTSALETLAWFSKASMITLVKLFVLPPLMTCSKEINICKWH